MTDETCTEDGCGKPMLFNSERLTRLGYPEGSIAEQPRLCRDHYEQTTRMFNEIFGIAHVYYFDDATGRWERINAQVSHG
ncbi:MAG: hypothetical protein WB777_14210 [Mycobacterium sp.]